jgi:phosphoribosylaminoimidazole-succinocarboxamide synthase
MALENLALSETSDFPIRHEGNVHSGKVRSVYWLNETDSKNVYRKISGLEGNPQLGIMIISDRISAFDCNWKGEDGLNGIPGKGAALNAISQYWFNELGYGIGGNHILETPHPLVWIVQKAEPIMVEAIARQYITGSMWRSYKKGEREFCGVILPEGLNENQKLSDLLITPTTKGILQGIPGVPEKDDVNITRKQIENNYKRFGFKSISDIAKYEYMLREGFDAISRVLELNGQIFVDTKFEFGYAKRGGEYELIFIDEIGTPDSSRMWDAKEYARGRVVENSKEGFRQFLLKTLDREVLLNSDRMNERKELAKNYRVPVDQMMAVSETYARMIDAITGMRPPKVGNAREEILDVLSSYNILESNK